MDVLCEWQRDWARHEDVREEFFDVVRTHGGKFGVAAQAVLSHATAG